MRATETYSSDLDLVVVGGGLAGLSAAALVAQAGRSVIVFEQAGEVGGRAATQVRQGISFNLGPHALYFLGHAFRLLRELDVPFTGRVPNPGKSRLLTRDGRIPPAPRAGFTAGITAVQPARERATDPVPGDLSRLDSHAFDGVSLSEWVAEDDRAGKCGAVPAGAIPGQHLCRRCRSAFGGSGDRSVEARPQRQRLVSRRRLAETGGRPAHPGTRGRCDRFGPGPGSRRSAEAVTG